MTGDEHRHADFVEASKDVHHFDRKVRVQIAGGFIGDEDRRLADDGARNPDPLLFACGQFDRQTLFAAEQPDLIERGPDSFADFLRPYACDDERECDVVEDRPVVQQFVILKNHADLTPVGWNLAAGDARHILAIDDELSASRPFDQRNELEQARFACAGVAG